MNSSRFDMLTALVLSGEANEEEMVEFEAMLSTSIEKQIVFEKVARIWNVDLLNKGDSYHKQRADLWRKYQLERLATRKNMQHNPIFRVAVAIVLLIAAGFIFNRFHKSDLEQETVAAAKEIIKETKPGEKLKTMLPDGTIVYLNAGSRLIYPSFFDDSSRVVRLTGEGYFEIAEDKSKPFTVKTASMDITALGTAFCVNVSQNNISDLVALVSGKLLITNGNEEQIKIDSGYTVKLSREDYKFSKTEINYLTEVAWKDGSLHFDNSNFNEIVQTLELNYGVKFIMDQQLGKISDTYTGTFRNESLDNVLKVLSFSMNFNYIINGKNVLIKSK